MVPNDAQNYSHGAPDGLVKYVTQFVTPGKTSSRPREVSKQSLDHAEPSLIFPSITYTGFAQA